METLAQNKIYPNTGDGELNLVNVERKTTALIANTILEEFFEDAIINNRNILNNKFLNDFAKVKNVTLEDRENPVSI